MYLILQPTDTIAKTNANFQLLFGYLKIEVYRKTHQEGELSKESQQVDSSETWGSLGLKEEAKIEFNQETTVADFEAKFKKLNIGVQVLRKSKELWLQTSSTDSWSLEEQDRHAREFAEAAPKNDEVIDYRDQD